MTPRGILSVLRRVLREIITPPALVVAAVLFLWEEVLWVGLGRAMARIGRAAPVARLEASIRLLPPYKAIALFLVPLALTYPPKFFALWLMATGHFWSGIALLAVLEVVAAALLGRVYTLCAPALRSLKWFAAGEAIVLRWSKWAHRRLGIKYFRDVMRDAKADSPFDDGGLT